MQRMLHRVTAAFDPAIGPIVDVDKPTTPAD
jgi:hypothetical protein